MSILEIQSRSTQTHHSQNQKIRNCSIGESQKYKNENT